MMGTFDPDRAIVFEPGEERNWAAMKSIWMGAVLLTTYSCIQAKAQVASMPTGATPSLGQTSMSGPSPFLGGVPSGKPGPGVMPLSLKDAVDRGLKFNLGLLLAEEGARAARGARLRALSELLPHLIWQTSETREQLSLKAFGFPGLPGVPPIVGPFSVFDTRAYLSQPVIDFKALHGARAESEKVKAAQYSYRDSRDLVVLVCADLYFGAIAGASRVDAAGAELKSAQAIYNKAVDLKKAGVIPGVDVLRAQVELQGQQQRLMFFQNAFEKQKLNLARAIGLPIGQEFMLADPITYAPAQAVTLEEALEQAQNSRADFQSAVALVRAAESNKRAAQGEGLPSLRFNADYGDIGLAPGASHGTFTVAANLRVPIFQGGLVRGKVLEADALLQQRKAELEDLRSRIDYEVRTTFMDLKSTGDQVQVAMSAADLAKEQVKQAQDRFAAGITNSLEVVQAQEALAAADENYISSLYGFNVAKASLVRAMGKVEEAAKQFLGGRQ
jgi:outer membrane protein TolC